MDITYRSHNFPPSYALAGTRSLSFTIQELMWAAVTVGRANFLHVLSSGIFSEYEILYRASIIVANLALSRNAVVKSSAFESLDPSEKSAVSYFLGLTFSKLLAQKLLGVPWLLHADVYRDQFLRAGVPLRSGTGRQRPDLIGLDSNNDWIVLESKGRSNVMDKNVLATAKAQTNNLIDIGGIPPKIRIAVVTHFVNGQLKVDWADPEKQDQQGLNLLTNREEYLSNYYRLVYSILANNERKTFKNFVTYQFRAGQITIGLERRIFEQYQTGQLGEIRIPKYLTSGQHDQVDNQDTFIGNDGILIGLGTNWIDVIKNNSRFDSEV
jgi:hypothetical protein